MSPQHFRPLFPSDYASLAPDILEATAHLPASYPRDYQRVDLKTQQVIQNYGFFEGRDVLDLGSNVGMHSFLLARHCRSVQGLEISGYSGHISDSTKRFLSSRGFFVDNVSFIIGAAKDLPSISYDALLACLVLYHLSNDEIDVLLNELKTKVSRIVIQARPARAERVREGTLNDNVAARNERYHGLYGIADNIQFLSAAGFKNIRVECNAELFDGECFPVILGDK